MAITDTAENHASVADGAPATDTGHDASAEGHGYGAHGDGTHSEVGVAGHGESVGLPQLDPEGSLFVSQLVWLALTFGFLYAMMARFALPRIATVIEERRDKIALDLDRAAEFKKSTDEAISAYETALREAKARAHRTVDETRRRIAADMDAIRKQNEAEIEKKLRAAESRIETARDKAMANLGDVAADLTREILGKMSQNGKPLDNLIADAVDSELTTRGVN